MRRLTIKARIILLICIAVAFAAIVGGGFYYALQNLKQYSIRQTQEVMLEGVKDKLRLVVHALAVETGEEIKGLQDKAAIVESIRKLTGPIRYESDNSGYIFVYEGTTNVSFPVKLENQGKDLGHLVDKNGVYMIKALRDVSEKGGGFVEYVFEKPGKGLQPKISYAELIPGTNMWIGTGTYIDNIEAEKAKIEADISGLVKRASMTILLVVLGLLIIVVLPLSLLIFRSIVDPLNAAAAAASDVAEGNLCVDLHARGNDEITRLEKALCTMMATLFENMEEITAKTRETEAKAQAAEEATIAANEAKAEAIHARRDGLLQAASRLETVVERLSSASEEIAGQAENIGRSTEVQKGRITETATAMEEMNATVLEVAKNAGQAAEGATTAKIRATTGNEVVGRSIKSMDDLLLLSKRLKENMDVLGKRAQDISQVMNVINDIADQTNLLALNAAIEAARAGDAGRGFAVVADEVRKLAEKTMTATKEVGETIRGIQEVANQNIQGMEEAGHAIEQSTDLVRQSGQALDEIVRMSENTSSQVTSIATAAEEQSAASEEINQAVDQINAIASETANSMHQTTVAIHELAEQAENLRTLVADLKREGSS
ncbi:MAG: methyl-accepting chemotaxis protein [Proteobacteria bacterium]|nr:methyl-accepting chemotaxis protein [Pseudomonadota bacterium]MBU1593930.1 methyl-accepting chemotaxis protein [Pseudomonadota bacterium]